MTPPGFDDVRAAHARIAPHIHRTPVLTCATLDAMAGARLAFKCENFQKVGAFKARGALNAVLALAVDAAARGVATHSSGNHGQALAWAARLRGIAATVVMPEDAPAAKRAAVEGYGGRVVACAPSNAARAAALERVVAETGAAVVHPFADPAVIAGQGTCAVEAIEDHGPFDVLVAPVGGGGLISGTCLAARALAPDAAVFAAEPEAADDAFRSKREGALVGHDTADTVADGLKASLAPITWAFVRDLVAAVLPVPETAIIAAQRLILERMKIVVEPSCATALAAILRNPDHFAGRRVCVILTGGNVDLDRPAWLQRAPGDTRPRTNATGSA